jgi:phosphate transport system substrate-binding protein
MLTKKKSIAITLATVALGVASVTSQKSVPNAFADSPVPLKTRVQLTGAGATFPAPLYQNWFVMLNRKVPNLQVNYQGTGSGAGVEQFIKGTVDFAGSDVAMKDEEIAKVSKGGVLMLPVTAGEIVLAYSIPGVSKLRLSQATYVDIFLGKITNWNDPKIAKDNPGVKFPDLPITVVHRSDGSGTTSVFTENLSAMSPEWKTKVGSGKSVQWPGGKFVGSKGNDGITATLKRTPGSIGYVEYGYAKTNKVNMAILGNKAGKFIEANEKIGSQTLAKVNLPANLRAFILNPSDPGAYPFVTYTWLLVHKQYDTPDKAIAIKAMIDYAINEGQSQSSALGYIPIPKVVRQKIAAAANAINPSSPAYKITVK